MTSPECPACKRTDSPTVCQLVQCPMESVISHRKFWADAMNEWLLSLFDKKQPQLKH